MAPPPNRQRLLHTSARMLPWLAQHRVAVQVGLDALPASSWPSATGRSRSSTPACDRSLQAQLRFLSKPTTEPPAPLPRSRR